MLQQLRVSVPLGCASSTQRWLLGSDAITTSFRTRDVPSVIGIFLCARATVMNARRYENSYNRKAAMKKSTTLGFPIIEVETNVSVLRAILRELKLIRAVMQGHTVAKMSNDELEKALTGILGVGPDDIGNKRG